MRHCPNRTCPHRLRTGRPAAYQDETATCADCGERLVAGTPEPSSGAPPLSRLAVTIAVPVVTLLAAWIRLPGVSLPPAYDPLPEPASLSIMALGLMPLLSGFVFVEIVALAIPRWRRLRISGASGRVALRRASLIVALVFSMAQAFSVATFLESLCAVDRPGWRFHLLTVLTLAAATAALFALTQIVDRWGLGNGFSVLILGSTLPVFLQVGGQIWQQVGKGLVQPAAVLLGILVAASLVAATGLILGGRQRRGSSEPIAPEEPTPFRIRMPACGTAPIETAASLLMVPATLSPFLPALEPLAIELTPTSWTTTILYAGLAAATAVLFGWLFNLPGRVDAVWGRVPGLEPQAAVNLLRPAILRSVIFMIVVVIGGILLTATLAATEALSVLVILVDTAILLDLAREWRGRTQHGDLVSVWPVHRVYAVDAALFTLDAEQIPAATRGLHHRTLLQFFAPYVAIDILVRPEDAERATRALESLLTVWVEPED